MAKTYYYAVKKGKIPGVYSTWEDCKIQVNGFNGAVYKKFSNLEDAKAFIEDSPHSPEQIAPSNQKPYAFIDGSFNSKTNIYGYGGFICINEKSYEIKGAGNDTELAEMRNVAGEILGCIAAVKSAIKLGVKELIIYYDYVGIEKWATGEWKRNKPGTRHYYDTMQTLTKDIDLTFVHVKGHSGIEGNETADRLAKQAVGINNESPQLKQKATLYFFKENGKYYTQETYEFVDYGQAAYEIFEDIKLHFCNHYKGMHMVVIFDSTYAKGFPFMKPATL